jgi:hypothetical protein
VMAKDAGRYSNRSAKALIFTHIFLAHSTDKLQKVLRRPAWKLSWIGHRFIWIGIAGR